MKARVANRSALSVCFVLCIHTGLLAWVAYRTSPTCDEVGHLPAGIYIWEFGRYDLYRVNPPLVRAWAALPVVVSGPVLNWESYQDGLTNRPEWTVGKDFIAANGDQAFLYFRVARWALLPLSVLGAFVCWRWATDLYGRAAGLVALTLWCFSPNVLAWGATITPDLGAAAVGVLAGWSFWRWLQYGSWSRAIIAGFTLGLAELTKTTWIVLFGVWPTLWLTWRWVGRRSSEPYSPPATVIQLLAVLLLGVYFVNLGYGFEGSFRTLGDYKFASRTLAGQDLHPASVQGGNCFARTWLAAVPVPLPENYVTGIDLQKLDFEQGKPSYLRGEWKHGGWWYYYLYAAALKIPLGTWILALLAIAVTLGDAPCRPDNGRSASRDDQCSSARHLYSGGWLNELALLLPPLVVFVLVSSQTGFSRYFRYVLPCFPFAFIWISKVARSIHLKDHWATVLGGGALAWSIGSSLWYYPHSMSYFNELAGGPKSGHLHLIDANIDWGQDMFYLKEWLHEHPEARPLHLANVCFVHPRHYGIEYAVPPEGPRPGVTYDGDETAEAVGPRPGWYAMSIHRIHSNTRRYDYFLRFEPVAMAGYSVYIYHITRDEANRVRRELGMPELKSP